MHPLRVFVASVVLCLGVAAGASAQDLQQAPPAHWGLAASVAPWSAGDTFKGLFEAQALSLSGGDVRFGVTHGRSRGGDWSLLYVRRTIAQGGTMTDQFGDRYTIGSGVVLTGVIGEIFEPVARIHRVTVGLVIGGGLANVKGPINRDSDGTVVAPKTVLTFFAQETPVQFLGRFELGTAIAVAPGMKVRLSGGFDWPGSSRFSVTALYFFGERSK